MRFFAEIKRRKVFHVAAAYAVVAWLLVQVAVAIEVPLDLPGWFDTVTIVLVALGFPLALILSWMFDWTSQGVMRDPGADAAQLKLTAPDGSGPGQRKALTAESTSLAELLAAGPLSTSRALSLAVRISDALADAHANGLVHRAVQPANIVLSADGAVELANFSRASAPSGDADSAYVSPEQARGEAPDLRSDQFSFGAVLYEMATGRRAFGKVAEADTLAAVIHNDPEPVSRLNPDIPLPLQWAIERCLAKQPSERYASTRDLQSDLASIADTFKASAAGLIPPAHSLPVQRTALIGRQEDLDEIKKVALDGGARLVTLTGAGGIGKTRLLIELGRQVLKDFRGGVFFAALDQIHDSELVIPEIAKALRMPQVRDGLDVAALKNHLRQDVVARTLLLIDNFEHLMDAASVLAELLAASEQLTIVVTSRAALRVYGEHEYRVAPLQVPDQSSDAERLAESPAIKLFLDRATSLPRKLDPSALATVAEICKRLDGLPLAIELAAARTKALSLSGLLTRVHDPLRVLAGGPRDSPVRQQTLRATLDWSFNLLDEDHQKLFRRLAVFVGGGTLEAIEAVCNVDEDLRIGLLEGVESLVDNSLLQQVDIGESEPRFTMLETMREYTAGRLAEVAGENSRTHRAHAAYCLVLAGESSYMTTTPQLEALYERFDRELGNLRASLDWLNETRNAEWGLRLCSALGHYWIQRGHAPEGFERIVKFLEMSRNESESELLMWALCWAGDLAANIGDHSEQMDRYHREALGLARKLGVVPAMLRSLNSLAVQTQQAGDLEAARAYHEEAVEIAREAGGTPALVGSMLSNYADHAMRCGDYDLAQRLHEETAELFREVGDEAALAWSLNHQGDIARRRQDLALARRLYDESLAKFRRLGDRAGTAACLYDLAAITVDIGDCPAAQKLHCEALTLYGELGYRSDIPRVFEGMTRCALKAGALKRALTLAGSAAAMRKTLSLRVRETTQAELDRGLDAARQQMSSSEAMASWMSGWGMPTDRAIAFALGDPQADSIKPG